MSAATCVDQDTTHLGLKSNLKSRACTFDGNQEHSSSEPLHAIGLRTRKRRQSIYAKPINAIWELFSDYSNFCTIHGVRYLGEKRRHWVEKVWWVLAVALSLYACGYLILATWQKWNQFPVLVTFAEKSTPISEIPFPAITICPSNKIRRSQYNYSREMDHYADGSNVTFDKRFNRFQTASNLCFTPPSKNITSLNQKTRGDKIFEELGEVVHSLKNVIYKCEWMGRRKSCSELFREVWTAEGLCFTFNMLDPEDLYTDRSTFSTSSKKPLKDDSNSTTTRKYDQLKSVNGSSNGLRVYMRLYDKDIDYKCDGPVQGFKILLHPSTEIPQVSKYYYGIALDHEITMSVKPALMSTSDSLVGYSPEKRQCVFPHERKLLFFKEYTQRNCELECQTNITLNKCNCVTFSMPHGNTTKICGMANKHCYKNIELVTFNNYCNCLPACSSITYDAELSCAKYEIRKYYQAIGKVLQDSRQYVLLFVSFKDNQFFSSHRRELYGPADFLANCGGLLGLFMGFSLLSLVEMVYYCTLRLACNLRKRRLQKKQLLQRHHVVKQVDGGESRY